MSFFLLKRVIGFYCGYKFRNKYNDDIAEPPGAVIN